MPRQIIIISTLVVLALLGASFWLWNANPERTFQFLKNKAASCANCRKQLGMSLLMYSSSYDGWFPSGKRSALESLSLLTRHDPQFTVHMLTSHDKQAELVRQWSDQKRLPEDLICYRYNAGLRRGDPAPLIMLYYYTPTRWECSLHKTRQIGRPVMSVDSSWTFLPEEEFARQQRRTEEFIRERGDDVPKEENGITNRSTRTAARRVPSDIPREHER